MSPELTQDEIQSQLDTLKEVEKGECPVCRYPVGRMWWRPIETAPKDGRRLLVFRRDRNGKAAYHVAKCNSPDDEWTIPGEGIPEPTHWMPLPPAPEADNG